ncbi:MAG: DUF5309 domain-containing protein [bacterium]|nr:DUF5309 domain-containing protein [bacterium]
MLNSFDVGTGNREDLLDIITNISPMDTLYLSGFEKVPANNISHEWLVDILAGFGDPDNGNADVQATPEGSDATFDPLVPRKRLCNLTHIIRRTFDVSDTQRDINTAGIRDEYVYQLRKATMELARFIEFALVHSERQSQTAQGNSGGVLPRKMDGYYAFAAASDPTCATTLGLGSDEMGTVTTVAGNSPDDCIDECILNAHLQAMWEKGAMTDTLWANAAQKRGLSNLVLNPNSQVRYNIPVNDRTVINTVDFYQSDFGTQRIYLHRYQRDDRIATAEANKIRVAVLRPVLAVELAKIGSSTKGMVEWEGTLEVLAPNAIGYIDSLCKGVPGCP